MKSERVKDLQVKMDALLEDYSDVVYKEIAIIIRDLSEIQGGLINGHCHHTARGTVAGHLPAGPAKQE